MKTIYQITVEDMVESGELFHLVCGDYHVTLTPGASERVCVYTVCSIVEKRPVRGRTKEILPGLFYDCTDQPFRDGPKKSLAFYQSGER